MNSEQIKCFMTAAKSESFTEAAQQMYMTQPTFGRYISSLEKEWGFKLFDRYGNRPKNLTPSGEVMYHAFEYLMEYYENYLNEAQQYAKEIQVPLRIGLLEGQLLDHKLSRILQAFSAKAPTADFSITRFSFLGLREAVSKRSIDVGITLTFDIRDNPDFDSLEIYTLPNDLVIPKDHPKAGKKNLHLSDFADDTFVTIDPRDSHVISGLLRQSCLDAGFEPHMKQAMGLNNEIELLEEGKAISPFNIYHQTCHHPLLTHVHLPEFPDVSFSAFWLNDFSDPMVLSFVEVLRKYVQAGR